MGQQFAKNSTEAEIEEVARQAESRPWLSITAITGVLFGLVGFYEPAKDLWKRWHNPSAYEGVLSVELADYQQHFWVKNSTCVGQMAMQEIILDDGTTARIGTCPNKDVLVQVYPKNTPGLVDWLSPESIASPKAAGLFPAMAASVGKLAPRATPPAAIPAQMRISTVCQAWQDPSKQVKFVRIVNENGTCFREVTNAYSGRIESREAVPCTSSCK
jgi:hypothetical protein